MTKVLLIVTKLIDENQYQNAESRNHAVIIKK